jgi:hypothetical protein
MELKGWMDLACSLHDSRTWATWPIISGNLDSIVVTRDDKLNVLLPCHSMHPHAISFVHQ